MRAARPDDLDRLVPLLQEMEAHYGIPPQSVAATRRRLQEVLFGTPALARLLVVVEDGLALGFVTCNTSFPSPGLGTRLVIEDLYVATVARNRGFGLRLLQAAAALAEDLGCRELGWTTDPGNLGAQRFYDRLAARRIEKVVYRIDAAALRSGVAS
ncbi:MAG TPA: GNAT family N-acetyltransferase [Kiloniellales bacterium]|nr:GNAT family N-acetyltransferase [Kiloniellales bacterium]